jgi:hypothetical protein
MADFLIELLVHSPFLSSPSSPSSSLLPLFLIPATAGLIAHLLFIRTSLFVLLPFACAMMYYLLHIPGATSHP